MDGDIENPKAANCESGNALPVTESVGFTECVKENKDNVSSEETLISTSKDQSSDIDAMSYPPTNYIHGDCDVPGEPGVLGEDHLNGDMFKSQIQINESSPTSTNVFKSLSSEESLCAHNSHTICDQENIQNERNEGENSSKGDSVLSFNQTKTTSRKSKEATLNKLCDISQVLDIDTESEQSEVKQAKQSAIKVESNRKRKIDDDNDSNSDEDDLHMEAGEADEDNDWVSDCDIGKSSDDDSSEKTEGKQRTRLEKEEDDKLWLNKDISNLANPRWRSVLELRKRQTLSYSRYWPCKVCGARSMVKRFKLENELAEHNGCVNALHFNQRGTLLASGSDDLKIKLWDWANSCNRPVVSYESGHKSNVFQAKFLPNCGDSTVVSAARDGQVRVGTISTTGKCKSTKKVAQHRGSVHKLAFDFGQPSTFFSCGEDGAVFQIDLRRDKTAEKIVTVKDEHHKLALYSIHTNPVRPYEFAVSGKDVNARVYDRRMFTERDDNTEPVKLFCPHHLQRNNGSQPNITCLVYNWDGSELLCSYNDDDIYLFDTSHSSGADYIKRYKGHRNNATVKSVNFYGPRSEFIVSGSDCGNIFYWEKESARVVALMEGDVGGVVNVLEPHPNLPVVATSGLDHEVKIWTPTGDPTNSDQLLGLKQTMLDNRDQRENDRLHVPDMVDSHMLWFLMHTLRSRRRRRNLDLREDTDSDDLDSSSHSSDSSDDSEDGRAMRCIQS